jgi:hypothetical protein
VMSVPPRTESVQVVALSMDCSSEQRLRSSQQLATNLLFPIPCLFMNILSALCG